MSFQHDKRVIVYPNYINAKKTVAEGRRIPSKQACENPTAHEMLDCCKHLHLPAEIEDKSYPRDWLVRGRLRVQLFNEDGSPVVADIPDRRTMLLKIADLVSRHPNRQGKKAAPAPAEASSSGGGKQGGKSSKKKKK